MKKVAFKLFLLLLTVSGSLMANAQTVKVSGTVVESNGKQPLISANIILINLRDTAQKHLATSDPKGIFVFPSITPQKYRLEIKYVGFNSFSKLVTVGNSDLSLGTISLKEKTEMIGEATIVGHAVRASVKGDTTSYNASAFKVTKDADAEALITKLPGVTSDNNTIKAQGEQVKKVLVDGKPFFGDDPTVALKSVPAEIIEKIEVFDKLSDQSAFTGFDDGNTTKTINIVTKANRRAGQFGKIYAGYGSNDRYNVGGNVNIFKGDARISLIGMSNNVNQQNFSSEDILGVLGSSGGRGGMRGGPGGGHRGGGTSNFMVGQQSGITKTSAFGINFSDKWGEKVNFSGSYFFNYSNTTNNQKTNRQYYGAIDTAQRYTYEGISGGNNYNNRLNLRIEYTINPKNSFIFTPNISFQSSRSNSYSNAQTMKGPETLLNKSENNTNKSLSEGYNINNEILFRHKFEKEGRTFSISLRNSLADKDATSSSYAENTFIRSNMPVLDTINQKSILTNKSYSINSSIMYTEPLGKKSQLMANYDVGYTYSDVDKRTKAYQKATQQYTLLDTSLSNVYESDYITQRLSLGYRLRGDKYNGMLNVAYQYSTLKGDETFPVSFDLKKSYNNILPMMMLNFKFNQSNSLRIMCGTRTQAPSISQLQSVVDNSDPLNLYVGNPKLNQSYSNNFNLRYSFTSMDKGKTFFVFFNAQNTLDYIGTSLYTNSNYVFSDNTTLKKNVTLSTPVNLDGYWNLNTMITYGFPLSIIKSNINISAGTGYTRYPSIKDNQKMLTNTYSPNGGVVIGSNISPNFDFTVSYNTAYNIVESNNTSNTSNNYWTQTGRFKLNWTIANRITILPEATYMQYNGSNFYYDNLTLNFNAGVKFLKNRQAEVKFGVFDLLDKNKSFSRSINSQYIEDSYNSVLSRYFMVTFVYNLRSFKMGNGAPQPSGERSDRPERFDRPDRHFDRPDHHLGF